MTNDEAWISCLPATRFLARGYDKVDASDSPIAGVA
jgi:hypothetical protein